MSSFQDSSSTSSASCNVATQGLFPPRPTLSRRRSGLRLVEGDSSADSTGSHDATQLAYEIMQHKTTM
ncbi:hypothetical protein M378DRAFT_8102 [Amanita muscaria Koide BX008]|uniref:Uncharacterized protein n=1 Tax=Amanita muscaria (strain Koide BX008) TaxID=946122 RepID=A0A0C2XJ14_AMAMK|nr:hypothetical protein M378DRAFT_8102 [Amanita muscaria Koide BX008]